MWNRESAPKTEPSKPEAATPSSLPPERRVVAWVGKSVIFRGDLISSEDMTIDGRVEGTIDVREHHLTIGPNGNIAADLTASSITVFGQVVGTVISKDKVDIRVGASVEGGVTCKTLAIQEGAYFCGKVTMGEGQQRPIQTTKPELVVSAGAGR
jgi:cytoskeletal protein CcmA (bactofilin family)